MSSKVQYFHEGHRQLNFALKVRKLRVVTITNIYQLPLDQHFHLNGQLALVVKKLLANTGDLSSVPGWGRSPGGGNGNPAQCSCLENPLYRKACKATVHGVTKVSDTTEAT